MIRNGVLLGGVVFLLGSMPACKSSGDPDIVANENQQLAGTIEAQKLRIKKLTEDRDVLDRRVEELEAKLTKMESTERVVEKAKDEISEHVRQVLARFKGDDNIEVVRTATGYRFVLREAVLFGTASTDLSDEGKRALARIADTLRDGDQRISIEGHTDNVPVKKPETLKRFPRGNIELSVGRAFAVWDYFTKEAQIDAKRVAVTGFGPNRPVVPNTSRTNQWRNRRVEIRVEER